jgi:ergothioneine biosynthesis protein EgtB
VDWIADFAAARAATLDAIGDLDQDAVCAQVHPDFSPLGWHFGHIAYTEALWLLVEDGGLPMPRPNNAAVFAVDALPKAERGRLPPLADIAAYADEVRALTLARLDDGAADRNPRLWSFILQHECQHCETMRTLRWLRDGQQENRGLTGSAAGQRVEIPAGPFIMGDDGDDAMDNERNAHRVDIPAFAIDRYPVTQGAFADFIAAGGYAERDHWSPAGWAWRTAAAVDRPLYWAEDGDDLPVTGVSFHEAEAYCRFRGVRLPTEAQWEKAARWDPSSGETRRYPWGDAPPDPGHGCFDRGGGGPAPAGAYPAGQSAAGCADMAGNQWEWTASPFAPYRGFHAAPYHGYSAAYFDRRHRVVKGGSWATRAPVLRSSFRNWYMPFVREISVGFRSVGEAGR